MCKIKFHLLIALLTFGVGVFGVSIWFIKHKAQKPSFTEVELPAVNLKNEEPNSSGGDKIPSLDEYVPDRYENHYSNYEYAYAIDLPKGTVGFGSPAPLPQHGIKVAFAENLRSDLYIDGNYNAAFLESLDEAADQQLQLCSNDGSDFQVLRRERTYLQNLPAIRLIVKYKSLAANEIRVHDFVIAFRPYEKDKKGIFYTLDLTSPEDHYAADVLTFEKIRKSWRTKPLPK